MEFVSVEGTGENVNQEDREQAMLDEEDDEPLFEAEPQETAEAVIGLA